MVLGRTPPPGITLDQEPPDDTPVPGDRRFRANYRVKTTAAGVNLRAEAGTNKPIVRSGLALGTGLCITGYPKARSDGLWYPVLLTGGSPANGFVRGDMLQLVKNPDTIAEAVSPNTSQVTASRREPG